MTGHFTVCHFRGKTPIGLGSIATLRTIICSAACPVPCMGSRGCACIIATLSHMNGRDGTGGGAISL